MSAGENYEQARDEWRYRTEWRRQQIEKEVRAEIEGSQPAAKPGLQENLGDVWEKRLGNIQAAIAKAKSEGGLKIVTPEQIAALHEADAQLQTLNDELFAAKGTIEELQPIMDQGASRWKTMWMDASAAIAGAMQTAFSDIVESASNARDAAVNMLKAIQRAISDAIFRQYILQNVFKAMNMIPGVALQAPAAQAPTVQTGQFSGIHQLSRGGIVYAAKGLFMPKGTDTVPAMLTPGEGVLDQDTTSRLRRILSVPTPAPQQTRPVNMNINAIDAQSTFAFFRKNRAAIATMLGLNKQVNHPATRS
jgi:hypothetical protein